MLDQDFLEEEQERVSELVIPRPLIHQLEDFEGTDRFLMLRWGRRTGKTRFNFIASTIGHGPGWRRGAPMFPGIIQGWDILWIGSNNPQTAQIWLEEILPRFDGLEGVTINRVDRTVTIEDHGTLHLRSAEAIGSVRGLGAKLKGVICDEAAHWPWLQAWRKEIRPVLMDNEGWAIITSTTNGGPDGELNEQGEKISPSGFNRRCMAVMRGEPGFQRSDGWHHSHKTARENPRIKPQEFAATCREYPPDSISLAQEMEAKLVAGGAGLAFPEWRDDLHIVRMEAPPDAVWFGGMDWGYSPSPTMFYAIASFGDRRLHYRHERMWRETTPYRVGYELGEFLKSHAPRLDFIACDPSMATRTTGPSIMEELQRGLNDSMNVNGEQKAPACAQAPKGPEQRQSRKLLLHELLRFEEITLAEVWRADGEDPEDWTDEQLLRADEKVVPEWMRPKGSWHPDCTEWISSVPLLPRSDKGKEDVDTNANDHPYDGGTYPLTARVTQDRRDTRDDLGGVTRDTHPGFTDQLKRKDPFKPPELDRSRRYQSGVKWRFKGGPDDQDDD